MADVEDGDEPGISTTHSGSSGAKAGGADKMFSLKKWNAVAMWSWDVECDTCAICRVQVMGKRSGGRQARSERKAAPPLCSPGTGMGRAGTGAKTAPPHSPPPSSVLFRGLESTIERPFPDASGINEGGLRAPAGAVDTQS